MRRIAIASGLALMLVTSARSSGPSGEQFGDTVTWKSLSSYEPHTVSFGPGYTAGQPAPEHFGPQGLKSGSDYSGGVSNSGLFGAEGGPFPPGPFTLKFTKAGEYSYVCALHPGMVGTVKVT